MIIMCSCHHFQTSFSEPLERFNPKLNMEQLNKTLISLNNAYDIAYAEGRPSVHEAEFRAYVLLLALECRFSRCRAYIAFSRSHAQVLHSDAPL